MNLVGPGTVTPLMSATNIGQTAGAGADKDFSPFSPFKMPGNIVNWGSVPAVPTNIDQKKGNSEATFKGFPSGDTRDREDMSKAPGYRTGGNSGNINISPGSSGQTNAAGPIQPAGSSAAGNWNKSGGVSNVPPAVDNNQLYQTQERCNSAPGTPVSPLVPSPIAPPGPVANVGPVGAPPGKMGSAPGPSATSGSTSSPGSDRDQDTWFSRPQMVGGGGPGLRSITPDPGDLGWGSTGPQDLEQTSRRHGTGSYGHNSPAKAPGGPLPDLFGRLNIKGAAGVDPTTGLATENLLSAAAQLSSLSNNYDMMPPSSSLAPGLPLPDTVYSSGGPGPAGYSSRFRGQMTSAMTSTSTTPIFSQPQPPMSAGLHKSLNPNAP